jgi:putative transposase
MSSFFRVAKNDSAIALSQQTPVRPTESSTLWSVASRRSAEEVYTSSEFAAKIKELDLRHSLGRTGICYDNALAESFFGTLKNERVHRTVYPTRKKARDDIARYIEIFYNTQRLHSGLNYRTPLEVRVEHLNRQLAA